MAVQIACPRCGNGGTIAGRSAVVRVRCKRCGDRFAARTTDGTAPPTDDLPAAVGRFRIRGLLGEGAFGRVYLARDPNLDRDVALKVLRPVARDDASRAERFDREALAAAGLRHPHIVPVFEVGAADGARYIAAEYVPGPSLDDAIPPGGMAPDLAARIVGRLADALAHAHAEGVVHRDVKPANVILADGDHPYLTDFGLAARADDGTRLTQVGAVLGTPAYMAPEQAAGETPPAPAADQYSLGVVLYELLTGRPPFEGPLLVVLHQLQETVPPPPSERRPGIPPELDAVCRRALAKNPDDRFPDLTAFARALAPSPVRGRSAAPRRLAVGVGVAAVVLALLVTTTWERAAVEVTEAPPIVTTTDPTDAAAPAPPGPDARGRMPVPPRSEIDAHRRALDKPTRQHWAALAPDKKRDAIRGLMAADTGATPAERYARLELARGLAAEAADAALAVEACDALIDRFAVPDPFGVKAAVLSAARPRVGAGDPARRGYIEVVLTATAAAVATDQFAAAEQLVELARQHTGTKFDDELDSQTALFADRVAECRAAARWVAAFAARPDDAAALARVGEHDCLFRDAWGVGLARMATGTDDDRTVARADAKARAAPEATVGDFVEAGDAWWALAETAGVPDAVALARRRQARFWYLKALGKASEAETAPLAARLVPRIDAVPTRPVVLRLRFDAIEGLHTVRVEGHGPRTTANSHGTRAVWVNHLRWDHGLDGGANTGAAWLYPTGLDCSTARVVRANAGEWGGFSFDSAPDHFALNVWHSPDGACNFDCLVAFEADGYVRPSRFTDLWNLKAYTRDPAAKVNLRTAADWDALFAGPLAHECSRRSIDFWAAAGWPYGHAPVRPAFLPDPLPVEHYQLAAEAEWEIPAGLYELRLFHDDAVRAEIDGVPVVAMTEMNWGVTTGSVRLAKGVHRLRVRLLQGPLHSGLCIWLRRTGP